MADSLSGEEDSSVETPPPPPPSDVKEDKDEERYEEQLKIFKDMAEFSANKNEGDDVIDDDGSVEVPPPANYEKMGVGKGDAGPKKYTLIAGCLLVIMAVVLGIGFGTGAFSGGDGGDAGGSTPAETPDDDFVNGETVSTPSPDSRQGRIRSYLDEVAVHGGALFEDPTTPEAQALIWLQDEDPLQLDPVDPNNHVRLDQRYALLTLWFNSPNTWFNETNWLNDDECTWLGVTCDSANNSTRRELQEGTPVVTKLELEGNNIQGQIPVDISLLVDLEILNLGGNALQGSIPSSLTNLESVSTFILNDNSLTGTLDGVDFSQLALLEILDLANNELSGSLPDSLWTVPLIEILVMDGNGFSGSIPASIANLQNLGKLWL